MRRATAIRVFVAVVVVGCLAFVGHWLWTTPLAQIPSKTGIGKLHLEQAGAKLQVRFVPPKNLSSISLLLAKAMPRSQEFCASPDFPLSVHVRVTEIGSTNVIDDVITRKRMQWTNWHIGPSLVLNLHGWLGQHLSRDREYDLSLAVDSAVAELGHAEVFLHWMDGAYIWGRETQKLQLTSRGTE